MLQAWAKDILEVCEATLRRMAVPTLGDDVTAYTDDVAASLFLVGELAVMGLEDSKEGVQAPTAGTHDALLCCPPPPPPAPRPSPTPPLRPPRLPNPPVTSLPPPPHTLHLTPATFTIIPCASFVLSSIATGSLYARPAPTHPSPPL